MRHYLPTIFDEIEEFKPLVGLLNRAVGSPIKSSDVTIGETDEMVFVDLPLPGCDKEKIQITYEKGSLLVNCEEEEEASGGVKYYVKSSRSCSYRIPIPVRVDEQAVPEASYKNGILRVSFQKSRSARPLKISIA
jgi:HSP20 family protein